MQGDVWRAVLDFAIETDEPATFLRTWREGDWETLRNEWPEAPKEIYPLDALAREYDAASED